MMILQFQSLFSAILRYGVASGIIALLVFSFPGDRSLVMRLIDSLLRFFSDSGVSFVVLNPSDGFVLQIYLALAVGAFAALPVGFREAYLFVEPGLYPRERRLLVLVAVFSFFLFIAGAFFGFWVIMPPSLSILLGFNDLLGVESLYSIRNFVGDLFLVTFFTGVAFTLPVAMVLLSVLGIVPSRVWREVWRYVIFGVLCFSALVTPDGTGVTMVLFSAPVGLLYFLGAGISYLGEKQR